MTMPDEKIILSGASWVDADPTSILTVNIAAHNEEHYIGACLDSLVHQDNAAGRIEVVVAANACTDRTADIVSGFKDLFEDRNWRLVLLNISEPGKPNAFNQGDKVKTGAATIYLDADVRCDPDLLGQLRKALSETRPLYATGTLQVAPARTWITRRYSDFWVRLPFVRGGAVGAGLFSVNAAGRRRWGQFPSIISDDTFVRLNFAPGERVEVPARYHWPMVEGLRNLIRVRRRQDAGVEEIRRLYPELSANDNKPPLTATGLLRLVCQAPLGFAVYSALHLLVRLGPGNSEWARGR